METQELTQKLEKINEQMKKNRNSLEAAENRKEMALKRQTECQTQYEDARDERQGLLASGKEVKQISDRIKNMQAEKELAEDEVIGLDNMLLDLKEEVQRLEKEKSETERDILVSKLLPLVPAYNEAAARLAEIVEKIWILKHALNEVHSGPYTIYSPTSWDEGALSEIPKLFDAGDPSLPNRDSVEAYHFRYRYFTYKDASKEKI